MRIRHRRRREVRRHQRKIVVLALKVERLARLPRAPARAHRTDVVFHPLRRLRPRHPEAPRHVAFDLRAEAEVQPPAAHPLQIPRGVRGRDRTLGEGERDAGRQLNLRRLLRGDRKLEIRIVLGLDREDRVVAERIGVAHLVANRAPRRLGPLGAILHVGSVRRPKIEAAFDFYFCHPRLSRHPAGAVKAGT